ncbi:hypothetical protein D3C85_1370290 [compost metagenome]
MTGKKPQVFGSSLNEQKLDSSSAYEYPGEDELNKFVLEFACAKKNKSATIKAVQSRLWMFCEFIKIYPKHELWLAKSEQLMHALAKVYTKKCKIRKPADTVCWF